MKSIFLFLILPLFSHGQLGYKEQSIMENDSLVNNSSSLKLYSLFDTKDTINKNFRFGYPLDGNVKVCGNQNNVVINAGGIAFQIKAKGVFLDSARNNNCKKNIVTHCFGGSKRKCLSGTLPESIPRIRNRGN